MHGAADGQRWLTCKRNFSDAERAEGKTATLSSCVHGFVAEAISAHRQDLHSCSKCSSPDWTGCRPALRNRWCRKRTQSLSSGRFFVARLRNQRLGMGLSCQARELAARKRWSLTQHWEPTSAVLLMARGNSADRCKISRPVSTLP